GARLAREAPDDAADRLVDLPLQLAVLRDPEPGRDRDLHQAYLAAPSRLSVEEALEAEQALDDPLRVVEPVDADQDDLRAQPLAQVGRTAAHGRVGGLRGERGRIDTDAVRRDADRSPREPHGRGVSLDRELEEPAHAVGEVAHVVLGLQPDDVRAEQPLEELLTPLADPEHLR